MDSPAPQHERCIEVERQRERFNRITRGQRRDCEDVVLMTFDHTHPSGHRFTPHNSKYPGYA